MSNPNYPDIAKALLALAKCVPNAGTISTSAKYDGVDFHLRTDEQAREVAAAFGATIETIADETHWWLTATSDGPMRVMIFGPTHKREEIDGVEPLDSAAVDAALALAKDALS